MIELQKERFEKYATERDWPKYRLTQIHHAREEELVSSWGEISTLKKEDREWLEEQELFDLLSTKSRVISEDKTAIKWLHETSDKKLIESVLLVHSTPVKRWATVCLSSQVGCPMQCQFCATGKMGFDRNLTVDEILDQFLIAKREAKKLGLTGNLNVVFMGMGEPLLNLEAVIAAVQILMDPKRHGFSPQRITISTCGIISGLNALRECCPKIHLAISLHAPEHSLRTSLMPVNKAHPLDDLMEAIRPWEALGCQVLYEYILIDRVNDSAEHAHLLAKLLRDRNGKVNLIPLNPLPEDKKGALPLFRSPVKRMKAFLEILLQHKIPSTLRHTKGDDIQAACGQLAGE